MQRHSFNVFLSSLLLPSWAALSQELWLAHPSLFSSLLYFCLSSLTVTHFLHLFSEADKYLTRSHDSLPRSLKSFFFSLLLFSLFHPPCFFILSFSKAYRMFGQFSPSLWAIRCLQITLSLLQSILLFQLMVTQGHNLKLIPLWVFFFLTTTEILDKTHTIYLIDGDNLAWLLCCCVLDARSTLSSLLLTRPVCVED